MIPISLCKSTFRLSRKWHVPKNIKKLGDLFQQNMAKSQAIIEKSKVSIPYQISPRHVTWQLPKEFSLENSKPTSRFAF